MMISLESKTIAILGGGVMQLPALRCAKQMNWTVILVDGNNKAVGRKYADYFEHIDLKAKENIAETLRIYKNERGLDGVFTAGTDFSVSVAWVAEQLALSGIPYRVAVSATDKEKMRRVFKKSHIPSPEFIVLTPKANVEKVLKRLDFPLVVKPVDNMGARGIRKVTSLSELKQAVKTGFSHSRSNKVIVEQYIEGPEFSIDAIVYNGDITICGIADRIICFAPYFIEMGHTMPTEYAEKTVASLVRVFKMGIKALGITCGAAKGDIKLSKNGPVVGEIAARLSGGYMSGWTYPYSSGVDVTKAALLIAVGSDPGSLSVKRHETSAERAFISIPGIIDNITGTEDAAAVQGIMDVFVRTSPGDKVSFPRNNVEKCGNVISKHPDRKKAVSSAEKAVQSIFIRLKPGIKETDQFLFRDSFPSISCFTLKQQKNLDALNSMQEFWASSEKLCAETCAVLNLPLLNHENTRDWHGMTILQALKQVMQRTGVHLTDRISDNKYVFGNIFWKAFLKGGVQAGVYVIDTLLRTNESKGKTLCSKRGDKD
jgi:biotin carboxylase